MTTKREFLAAIASLGDDDDIVIALTYPKPEDEDSFTLGDEADSPKDSPSVDSTDDDDDDGSIDNEDGTVTEFYPEYDVHVEDADGEGDQKRKVAFINLELGEDDEDEDESEDSDPSED